MWALICLNQRLCSQCLRHLQFRTFNSNRASLNVTKILQNIQNYKEKSTKSALSKKSSKTNSSSNPTRTTNSHRYKSPSPTTTASQSAFIHGASNSPATKVLDEVTEDASEKSMAFAKSDFEAEYDSSMDIFKELGVEVFKYEKLDEGDFISRDSIANNACTENQYHIFDDSKLSKRNLLSFIHVCIYNDNLSEAHSFLLQFIGKFSHSLSASDTAHCCELLIKGWARKGNTENVRELKCFIKDALKIRLNLHIYEYYLLSLAKQMKETTNEDVRTILAEIKENGLDPAYLLFRTTLNTAETKLVRSLLNRSDEAIHYRKYYYPKNYQNLHMDQIVATKQKHYEPFQGVELSKIGSLIDEQFLHEMNSVVKVEPIDACFYDNEAKKPEKVYKKMINILENEWRTLLTAGFQNYLKSIRTKQKRINGIPMTHYMSVLEPEAYVEAMLDEIRKCSTFSEHYSPFSHQIFEELGRKMMYQYLLRSNTNDGTLADFRNCYKQYVKYSTDPNLIKKYNPREYWQHLMENGFHYYFDESKMWPLNVIAEIGKDLYEIITSEAKFNSSFLKLVDDTGRPSIQPVITFVYKSHETYKMKREVRVHPLLIKLYQGAGSFIHFETNRLPMLSPPVPWINVNFGGNLLMKNFIVRPPMFYPRNKLARIPVQQMYPTFDSLNALSLCPWKINTNILDIAIGIFKNKGDLDLDIPVSLSYFNKLPQATSEMSTKEKTAIYCMRKAQKKEQAEMYSLWVDCLYKLSIGNFLRDRVFWFPINTDFRSRVYPIPPNFNHLCSDLSRAMLLFAKGKPLGERGFNWLKVHTINLTGLKKKSSVEERLAYADEVMDLIMDSADNPVNGQKWWMQSDDMWQTLASCIELTNAIRSGDPHNYVSHIPIHQDGSCNGLQHYAALGRDALGAKSVNLSPSVYPRDVYSDVAAMVESLIDKDIEKDIEIAKIVRNFISRKIVKHTVMTYVYGVTKYGAKLQVLKRLKEDAKFPEEYKVTASVYIAEKIFLSIRKMFTQTRVIQDWLTNCAQIISNEYNSSVEWVTPLGYPVIQAYYKDKPNKKTPQAALVPNTMKQKNAFPANFIHSLDSSHMMLTALECHRNGLTFASVHDCYWTHASQIDEMNHFCRKQFVALHSQPLLDDLAIYLKDYIEDLNQTKRVEHHSDFVSQVNQRIKKGEFDLNSVMDSVYFFS